jgi:hypothetical protein
MYVIFKGVHKESQSVNFIATDKCVVTAKWASK